MLISCATLQQPTTQLSDLNPYQLAQFQKAIEYAKKEKLLKAAEIYDNLAKHLSGKSLEVVMLFNSGSLYRQLGDCEKSVDRYRKTLEKSLRNPTLKSRTLLEISYSYECLGNFKSSYLSLKDLEYSKTHLSQELAKFVYPARLGIAYSWMGKKSQAKRTKLSVLKEMAIHKTLNPSDKKLENHSSFLFYSMGKSHTKITNLKDQKFIRAFPYHQFYLLQSILFNNKDWSHRSKKELAKLFDNLVYVFARSNQKDRNKYAEEISKSLGDSKDIIKKEKSPKIRHFYNKQTAKIRKFL